MGHIGLRAARGELGAKADSGSDGGETLELYLGKSFICEYPGLELWTRLVTDDARAWDAEFAESRVLLNPYAGAFREISNNGERSLESLDPGFENSVDSFLVRRDDVFSIFGELLRVLRSDGSDLREFQGLLFRNPGHDLQGTSRVYGEIFSDGRVRGGFQ